MYRPAPATNFDATQNAHLNRESEKVSRAFIDAADFLVLKISYKAPEKPRAGWLVYADGSTWNPAGSGEGLHRYSLAGTWIRLG